MRQTRHRIVGVGLLSPLSPLSPLLLASLAFAQAPTTGPAAEGQPAAPAAQEPAQPGGAAPDLVFPGGGGRGGAPTPCPGRGGRIRPRRRRLRRRGRSLVRCGRRAPSVAVLHPRLQRLLHPALIRAAVRLLPLHV